MYYCTNILDNSLECFTETNEKIVIPKQEIDTLIKSKQLYSFDGSVIVIPELPFSIDSKEKLLQASLCNLLRGEFYNDIYVSFDIDIIFYDYEESLTSRLCYYYHNRISTQCFGSNIEFSVNSAMSKYLYNLGIGAMGRIVILFYKNHWYFCNFFYPSNMYIFIAKNLFDLNSKGFKVLKTDVDFNIIDERDF